MAAEFKGIYPELYDVKTGKPAIADTDLDFDEKIYSQDYFVKKGSKVPMLGQDGKTQLIPIEQYEDARFNGAKFHSVNDQFKQFLQENYGGAGETARGMLEAAGRGVTLGLSDYLMREIGSDPKAMAYRKEASPIATTMAEWTGILGTGLVGGAGKAAIARGAEMTFAQRVARMTPLELSIRAGDKIGDAAKGFLASTEANTLAKKIIKSGLPKVASGAVSGGMMGAGFGLSEAVLGDEDMTAESILAHIGPEALFGAVFGAVAEPLMAGVAGGAKTSFGGNFEKAKSSMGDKAKALFEMMSGTPAHVQDHYLKNIDKIKQVEPIEAIIGKTSSEIATAKELRHEIQEGYKNLKDNIKAKIAHHDEIFNKDLRAARMDVDATETAVKDQYDFTKEVGSDELQRAANFLNGKFSSIFVDDALEKSLEGNLARVENGKFINPTDDIIEKLYKLKEKYKSISQESKARVLEDYISQITIADRDGLSRLRDTYGYKLPHEPPGEPIESLKPLIHAGNQSYMSKKFIRGMVEDLNNRVNWDSLGANGADAHVLRAEIREIFQETLKEVSPVYKKLMEESAAIKKGFKQGNLDFEAYENKKTASSKLEQWMRDPDAFKDEIKALAEYEKHLKKHGFDFKHPEWTYLIEAHSSVKSYSDKLKKALRKITGESSKVSDELRKTLEMLKDPKNHPIVFEYLETEAGQQSRKDYLDMIYRELDLKSENKLLDKFGKTGQLTHETVGNLPQTEQELANLFKKTIHKDPKVSGPASKLIEEFLGKDSLEMIKNAAVMDYFEQATFRNGSSNPVVWSTIMGAITGFFGGGGIVGAAAGGVIGKYVDMNGPKIVRWMLDKYAGIAAAERMAAEQANYMDKKLSKFLGVKPGEYVRSRALPMAILPDYDISAKIDKKIAKITAEDYAKMERAFSSVATNPMAVINHIGSAVSPLSLYVPKAAKQISNKASGAATFLNQKMPKNPTRSFQPFKGSEWRPSDAELKRFARYYQTVTNPMSVFDSLEKGTITNEQVEAMKAVYPKMYTSAVQHIIEQIADSDVKLSNSKKLELSVFFGQPVHNTARPEFIAAMQTLHAEVNMSASNQPQARPSVKMAEAKVGNMMSATDSTINRA